MISFCLPVNGVLGVSGLGSSSDSESTYGQCNPNGGPDSPDRAARDARDRWIRATPVRRWGAVMLLGLVRQRSPIRGHRDAKKCLAVHPLER